MKTLIALPVYNKAAIISQRVNELLASFPETFILVIDDESDDSTAEAVKTGERVNVISHSSALGYGGCVMTALEFASGYDALVFADVSHKNAIGAISEIISLLNDSDIVSLSRVKTGTDKKVDEYLIYNLGCEVTEKLNAVTGLSLADPFSPFKGFRLSALENMTLEEFDEALIIQMWIQAVHFGRKITEQFCAQIEDETVNDSMQLENDADRYMDFIDGEIILYPCGDGHTH